MYQTSLSGNNNQWRLLGRPMQANLTANSAMQVQEELSALKLEVLGYKGLSDSQVDELLAQEAQPVLEDRRSAAAALLQCADTFLKRQAAEWQLAVQALSSWLGSVVTLYEIYKASTAAAEASVKSSLRAAVKQFESEHAAREAALAGAVQLLSQGSDKKELDVRLEAALQALSAIQAGYRMHSAAAASTVRAYPGQVKDGNDMYIKCLCGLLHVQPHQQTDGSKPAGGVEQHAAAVASAAGSVAGAAVQSVAAPASVAAGSSEQSAVGQPAHGQVQLPTGGLYDQLHDLWKGLKDATPKPWLAQFSHMQHSGGPEQQPPAQPDVATAAAPQAPAPAPAAAAAATAPSVSGSGAKVAPGTKLTKQQLAEAAAAEEAARAAEAAAAAAAAEAAAYAAAVAQPPSPMSSSSGALCLSLLTPDGVISDNLLNLQVMRNCWSAV